MEHNAMIETAKSISDFGMLAMAAAAFLLVGIALMSWVLWLVKKFVNNMMDNYTRMLNHIQESVNRNGEAMIDIAEGLRPETQMQIKNISGVYFDLAVEKVCRIIKRVRTENNIANRAATQAKIRRLLQIQHDDRNSRFDSHTYRGRKLSEYCNPDWIEWVAEVIENELYNDTGANNGRAYNNVSTVYSSIKADFYKNLQGFHIEHTEHSNKSKL